jgi:hypothetical protein
MKPKSLSRNLPQKLLRGKNRSFLTMECKSLSTRRKMRLNRSLTPKVFVLSLEKIQSSSPARRQQLIKWNLASINWLAICKAASSLCLLAIASSARFCSQLCETLTSRESIRWSSRRLVDRLRVTTTSQMMWSPMSSKRTKLRRRNGPTRFFRVMQTILRRQIQLMIS